jgi:hypothetical protein
MGGGDHGDLPPPGEQLDRDGQQRHREPLRDGDEHGPPQLPGDQQPGGQRAAAVPVEQNPVAVHERRFQLAQGGIDREEILVDLPGGGVDRHVTPVPRAENDRGLIADRHWPIVRHPLAIRPPVFRGSEGMQYWTPGAS